MQLYYSMVSLMRPRVTHGCQSLNAAPALVLWSDQKFIDRIQSNSSSSSWIPFRMQFNPKSTNSAVPSSMLQLITFINHRANPKRVQFPLEKIEFNLIFVIWKFSVILFCVISVTSTGLCCCWIYLHRGKRTLTLRVVLCVVQRVKWY